MSEKTPIRALIEEVEAGVEETLPWRQVFGWDDTLNADAAHNGSLDAALALHEALLPGVRYLVGADDAGFPDEFGAVVFSDPKQHAISSSPARAWLLAILRAYEARHG